MLRGEVYNEKVRECWSLASRLWSPEVEWKHSRSMCKCKVINKIYCLLRRWTCLRTGSSCVRSSPGYRPTPTSCHALRYPRGQIPPPTDQTWGRQGKWEMSPPGGGQRHSSRKLNTGVPKIYSNLNKTVRKITIEKASKLKYLGWLDGFSFTTSYVTVGSNFIVVLQRCWYLHQLASVIN